MCRGIHCVCTARCTLGGGARPGTPEPVHPALDPRAFRRRSRGALLRLHPPQREGLVQVQRRRGDSGKREGASTEGGGELHYFICGCSQSILYCLFRSFCVWGRGGNEGKHNKVKVLMQ